MTTISCDEARAHMAEALGDQERPRPGHLAAHLAACAACAEEWRVQSAVRAVLASRDPALVPAGFVRRVDEAIDALSPWWMQFDFRWWTLRVAPVAAALLLLVGGAAAFSTGATTTTSGQTASVTTALWDANATVSNDSLLLAVLSGSPDDDVARYEGTTR